MLLSHKIPVAGTGDAGDAGERSSFQLFSSIHCLLKKSQVLGVRFESLDMSKYEDSSGSFRSEALMMVYLCRRPRTKQ